MIENHNISITGYDVNFPGAAIAAPATIRLAGAVR